MGFPSASYCFVVPKYVLVFLFLFDCIIYAVSLVLFYIGLSPSAEAPRTPSWEETFDLDFTAADASTITPKSLGSLPSSVKRRLPVVELASVLKRSHGAFQGEEEEPMCAVCLGRLEERDKVRELGNCCHVFHVRCIDQWVDVGRLTCPLCRYPLLPQKPRRGVVLCQLRSFFRSFSEKLSDRWHQTVWRFG